MRDVLGRRFLASLALLGSLVAANALFTERFVVIVAAALIVAPVVTGVATYYFTRDSVANPSIIGIRERAQTSFLLFMASMAGAILGMIVVGRELGRIGPVPRDTFLIGLAFALILIAGPAANGLVAWQPWRDHEPVSEPTAEEVARRTGHPPVER